MLSEGKNQESVRQTDKSFSIFFFFSLFLSLSLSPIL